MIPTTMLLAITLNIPFGPILLGLFLVAAGFAGGSLSESGDNFWGGVAVALVLAVVLTLMGLGLVSLFGG